MVRKLGHEARSFVEFMEYFKITLEVFNGNFELWLIEKQEIHSGNALNLGSLFKWFENLMKYLKLNSLRTVSFLINSPRTNSNLCMQFKTQFSLKKYFLRGSRIHVCTNKFAFGLQLKINERTHEQCMRFAVLRVDIELLGLTKYHIDGHLGSLRSDVNDLRGFSRVKSRF